MSSMGALSPYDDYDKKVKLSFKLLETYAGTAAYYNVILTELPKIEEARQQHDAALKPFSKSHLMTYLVASYYKSLELNTEDTDGKEEDEIYNIDMIAQNDGTLTVAQIKSGRLSNADIRKFCRKAPEYVLKNRGTRTAMLDLAAIRFDKDASKVIAQLGTELFERNVVLSMLPPEILEKKLSPKDRRILRELNEKP